MAAATLTIDLIAKLASFEEGLGKAARLSEKTASQIESSFAGLKKNVETLGKALGLAFSVGAIKEWFLVTAEGIEKLKDLKDATGASIENISALEDVALRTGNSFESMAASLVKFNKVLTDATPNSEAAEIFKKLGLNAAELKRIDPAEALHRAAIALSQYADDGNKARAVQELFGKSVQEFAPFLKELAEQGELNGRVTTKQVQEAERFNHQLAELKKNSLDFSRSIVGDAIPALSKLIERFQEVRKNGDLMKESLKSVLTFSPALSTYRALFPGDKDAHGASGSFGSAGGVTGSFGNPDPVDARPAIGKIETADERAARLKKIADAKHHFKELLDAAPSSKLESARKDMLLLAAAFERGTITADKFSEAAQARLGTLPDKYKDMVEAQKHFDDLLAATPTAKLEEARKDMLLLAAAFEHGTITADQYTEAAQARLGTLPDKYKEMADAQKHFDDMLAATPTAKLEETRKDMLLLADALERGAITADQFTEAAQARLGIDKFKDAVDDMSKFAEEAARNIQDALGDTIYGTLSGKFDDIGARWTNLLNRMASEALAAQIGKSLFGDFAKTGDFGGILGDLFKGFSGTGGGASAGGSTGDFARLDRMLPAANGHVFGADGLITAFASGGIVSSPTLFGFGAGRTGLMGEAGPEAVVPLMRGSNGKLGVASGGGRAVTVNYSPTIHVDARTDQAQVAEIAAEVTRRGQKQLLDQLHASGVV